MSAAKPVYVVGVSTFGEGIYGIHIRENFLSSEGALRLMTGAEMAHLAHIGNAHESLVAALEWAMEDKSKPTLIRGQNDTYVAKHAAARLALSQAKGGAK